jgi:pyruvate dehydrogenase E2 component (dihydrolipoamide acetyltransferase)
MDDASPVGIERTITCPSFCRGVDAATVVAWEVAPGETFSRGQVVVVLETSKCALEHHLMSSGTMLEHLVEVGEEVGYGEPLMRARLVPASLRP